MRPGLIVVESDEDARGPVAAANFRQSHLVSCHAAERRGDLERTSDPRGRLRAAYRDRGNCLPATEVTSCVQRLQELGNYRNLALIGLAAARSAWTRLDEIELALSETGRSLLESANSGTMTLLAAPTAHSEQLLSIAAETDFRTSATASLRRDRR